MCHWSNRKSNLISQTFSSIFKECSHWKWHFSKKNWLQFERQFPRTKRSIRSMTSFIHLEAVHSILMIKTKCNKWFLKNKCSKIVWIRQRRSNLSLPSFSTNQWEEKSFPRQRFDLISLSFYIYGSIFHWFLSQTIDTFWSKSSWKREFQLFQIFHFASDGRYIDRNKCQAFWSCWFQCSSELIFWWSQRFHF